MVVILLLFCHLTELFGGPFDDLEKLLSSCPGAPSFPCQGDVLTQIVKTQIVKNDNFVVTDVSEDCIGKFDSDFLYETTFTVARKDESGNDVIIYVKCTLRYGENQPLYLRKCSAKKDVPWGFDEDLSAEQITNLGLASILGAGENHLTIIPLANCKNMTEETVEASQANEKKSEGEGIAAPIRKVGEVIERATKPAR